MKRKFKHLVLAGTFDHLHKGHQHFIAKAVRQCHQLSCGLTTGWANKNKLLRQCIQPFGLRRASLEKYLKANFGQKITVFPLKDPIGPAKSSKFDAIAATKDSLAGVRRVNQARKLKNLAPLPVYLTDLVLAEDNISISSTRVRTGEINRQGRVYNLIFAKNKILTLPQANRIYFKKPMGRLFFGTQANQNWAVKQAILWLNIYKPSFVISVGDITTQSLIINNIKPDLALIDYRCQRQPVLYRLHEEHKNKADFIYSTDNEPGTINVLAVSLIKKSLEMIITRQWRGIIDVKGEEDLLVLPLLLLAPLDSAIFYGQPNSGMVAVRVTEAAKKNAISLLQKFSL